MGILAALFTPAVLSSFVDMFVGRAADAYKAYINKEISMEELKSRVRVAMLSTISDVETAHAEALAKTFDSFMKVIVQSKLMQMVWAIVVLSQLAVLVLQQTGLIGSQPSIEWAYVLIGGLCGLGPLVLRHGPGVLPMQSMKNAVR
jgi:hypothetical protein